MLCDSSQSIIEDIIKPQTDLEKSIISDPEFIAGALWGKSRPGHPEGLVIYHIKEVLENIKKYKENGVDYEKLRLIAIIHDTFKYKVDTRYPKSGENHHAMIARRFAEKYIEDNSILDIIELHDEAYNAWQTGYRRGDWENAEKRGERLVKRLGKNLSLFFDFYLYDGLTGDKNHDDYEWFMKLFWNYR